MFSNDSLTNNLVGLQKHQVMLNTHILINIILFYFMLINSYPFTCLYNITQSFINEQVINKLYLI